jgi:hypothetical protein
MCRCAIECVYVGMCMCMCVCVCVLDYTNIRTNFVDHLSSNPIVHTYIDAHIHTNIHACIHACIRTYVYTYIHTYTHTHAFTCTCAHRHLHIHTNTNTQDPFLENINLGRFVDRSSLKKLLSAFEEANEVLKEGREDAFQRLLPPKKKK